MRWAFRTAAVGALTAAAIHAATLALPAVAALYPASYPPWRHGAFIAIDVTLAGLFLKRPRWFVWAYGVLTVQVIAGHGRAAWASWHRNGHVALIDAAAIIVVPLVPWNRDGLHKSRSAAPVWQGATSELIGHK